MLARSKESDDFAVEARSGAAALRASRVFGDFHVGGLQNLLDLSDESEQPLRSVSDVVVNASDLLETLSEVSDNIETVHVLGDRRLAVNTGSETVSADNFGELLSEAGHDVHEIDVIEERDLAN